MSLPRLSLSALLCCAPLAGVAAPPSAWQGELDGAPLHVCFSGSQASYYTLPPTRIEELIPDAGAWQEKSGGARWTLQHESPSRLVGVRQPEDGRPPQQIVLSPLGNGVCADTAFSQPLTVPVAGRDEQRQFEDRRYLALLRGAGPLDFHAEQVALPPGLTNAPAPPPPGALPPAWQQCLTQALRSGASPAHLLERTTPVVWNRTWLTLATRYESQCGEQVQAWSGYRTWHLPSGNEVDLWSWFGQQEDNPRLPWQRSWGHAGPALQRILGKAWPDDESDCLPTQWAQAAFAVRPSVFGLVFERVDADDECTTAVEVAWSRLVPALTPAGRKQLSALAASVRE